MQYEFHYFEEFIYDILPALNNAEVTRENFLKYSQALNNAAAFIRSNFRSQSVTFEGRNQLELYIRGHQSSLVALCDASLPYINIELFQKDDVEVKNNSGFNSLVKHFYQLATDLFVFMKTYFRDQFHEHMKLPEIDKLLFAAELKPQLQVLQVKLKKIGADEQLFGIALFPFHELTNLITKSAGISFCGKDYLRTLLSQIIFLADKPSAYERFDDELFTLLCNADFNTDSFIDYCIQKNCTALAHEESTESRLVSARQLLKANNQFRSEMDVSLYPLRPSLKEQLSHWLHEEVNASVIYRPAVEHPEAKLEPVKENTGTKLNVSITVAMLAFLVRLLVDIGVLKDKQFLTNILRFFASNFTTPRATLAISDDSFANCYYSPERNTVIAIRALLLKMVDLTKKFYP